MESHLAECAECRSQARRLAEQSAALERRLDSLDPAAADVPAAGAAYVRFRSRLARAPEPAPAGGLAARVSGRLMARRWRLVLVGGLVAAGLVSVIGFAPARLMVSRFLGIFRVQKFSAIPIEREQLDKLQKLGENLKAGIPAEPVYERKPGEPQAVAGQGEASSLAGFAVKMPTDLPAGMTRTAFTVAKGPAVAYEFDRDRVTAQLQAAGLTGITLPPMQTGTIRVDVPAIAMLSYQTIDSSGKDTTRVQVIQVGNPVVTLPPGADPAAWGEMALQVLGVPDAEAKRLAASIDWTNTMVVPLPRDLVNFKEVEIGGRKGLLVEMNRKPGARHQGSALLWEADGVVYSVQGDRILGSALLQIAESLR